MSQISYLTIRSGVYYARMDVPLDLVPVLKKTTLKRSLKTKNISEAKRRLWPVIAEWNREFDEARSRRNVTQADYESAVWKHYNDTLARDEQQRERLPSAVKIEIARTSAFDRIEKENIDIDDPLATLEAIIDFGVLAKSAELSSRAREIKLGEMRKHLARGETALIAHEVDEFTRKNHLYIERSSPEWISLARHMMRAEIGALERTLERDNGDYSGQPRDPLIKPPTSQGRTQVEVAEKGESISEAVEVFRNENPRNVSMSRMSESCRDIGIFIETIGPGFPVKKITKKHVRDWKTLLMKYPVRATEVAAFRGMNINQIVEENEKLQRQVLSDRTVNRYLSSLSAFCSWAEANGYISSNPCTGMSLQRERRSRTLPFTTDQMNLLFKSPLFAGAQSDSEWRYISHSGSVKIRDHRFWVPLIMLFSGARPGEIGQLAVGDVRQEHGQWIMHITIEGESHAEGKSVKTTGSMRVIPIHSDLKRLGFLKYHAEQAKSGSKQLFPDAKRNERGQMMADYSREFGKYITRIGLKKGRGLSLYSFRHGATDALRRAGYLDDQFGFILGHSKGSMTGRYGIMPQGMLERRVELVNAIAYPGLDLDHLVA